MASCIFFIYCRSLTAFYKFNLRNCVLKMQESLCTHHWVFRYHFRSLGNEKWFHRHPAALLLGDPSAGCRHDVHQALLLGTDI